MAFKVDGNQYSVINSIDLTYESPSDGKLIIHNS